MASNPMPPGRMRGWVDAIAGFPIFRSKTSIRAGSGTGLSSLDGNDGLVMANGATAGLVFANRALPNTLGYGAWYFDGTNFYLSNASSNLWQINPNNGITEPQTAWTSLTGLLQNSWVSFGGSPAHFDPAYCMDMFGFVCLRGAIKSGTTTSGTTLFTLPSGFRPSKSESFGVSSNAAYGELRVDNTGDVKIFAGSNTIFSLNGVRFDTRS